MTAGTANKIESETLMTVMIIIFLLEVWLIKGFTIPLNRSMDIMSMNPKAMIADVLIEGYTNLQAIQLYCHEQCSTPMDPAKFRQEKAKSAKASIPISLRQVVFF